MGIRPTAAHPQLRIAGLVHRWRQVVEEIEKQGLSLGVYAELPPKRDWASA